MFAALSVMIAGGLAVAAFILADVYFHARALRGSTVNMWGYRGPAVGAKRSNEKRVVALGGSTVFGYSLYWHESWPSYLEQQLNGRGTARRYSVVNLGAPAQGAYGFRFDLEDYSYLQYDAAILYEGYNDLGTGMTFDATKGVVNRYLWRRQSPVFRLTGYFPILPLIFREKALMLQAGGDLNAAYGGTITFKPGLATRATATALTDAAAIADSLMGRLGRLTAAPELSHEPLDFQTWRSYTTGVVEAVIYARRRGAGVIVATQPYMSDSHVAQQRALEAVLRSRFSGDPGVRYINLGTLIDIKDSTLAFDGMHLVPRGNRMVAERFVDPIVELTGSQESR